MSTYLHTTQEAGKRFYQEFHDKGKVVMLNLLKFRETADYSKLDNLKPSEPISGKEAYDLYINHTLPILTKAGGKVLYYGAASDYVIGPDSEKWDVVLLVEHASAEKFIAFAQDEEYLKGAGHRTAALADSRLLPSVPLQSL